MVCEKCEIEKKQTDKNLCDECEAAKDSLRRLGWLEEFKKAKHKTFEMLFVAMLVMMFIIAIVEADLIWYLICFSFIPVIAVISYVVEKIILAHDIKKAARLFVYNESFDFLKDMPVTMLPELLIAGEIYAYENEKKVRVVDKNFLRTRLILTVAFVAALFVFSEFCYTMNWYKYVVLIAIALYIFLICKNTVLGKIVRSAKKEPWKQIIEIIETECVTISKLKVLKVLLLCASMILIACCSFVCLHLDNTYTTENLRDGCIIVDYEPSFFAEEEITIPSEIDGKKVYAIAESAFKWNDSVRKIVIPNGVTQIGSYAFKGCSSLEHVKLPTTLTELNGESFKNCSSLKSIVIPEGVTAIRGNTFEGCASLKSVTLHDGITAIHAYAFKDCTSLAKIQLPLYITEIRKSTFEGCTSLSTIEIPKGVTRIAAHAFRDCDSLHNVILPDTVQEIGSSAFRSCDKLKHIYLPKNIVFYENSFKGSPVDEKITKRSVSE